MGRACQHGFLGIEPQACSSSRQRLLLGASGRSLGWGNGSGAQAGIAGRNQLRQSAERSGENRWLSGLLADPGSKRLGPGFSSSCAAGHRSLSPPCQLAGLAPGAAIRRRRAERKLLKSAWGASLLPEDCSRWAWASASFGPGRGSSRRLPPLQVLAQATTGYAGQPSPAGSLASAAASSSA